MAHDPAPRLEWRRRPAVVLGAVALALLALAGGSSLYVAYALRDHSRPAAQSTLTPTAAPTAPPTATPIPLARPDLQAGFAFPHWNTSAYGPSDSSWQTGLVQLRQQTGARWVSIVVTLYQDTAQATQVHAGDGTPTPDAVEAGILAAHDLGLHVFIEPLLDVINGNPWGGWIYYSDPGQAQAWFDSYWAAYAPYVRAAAAAGAEQMGIATELDHLELEPDALWNQLISRVHGTFSGRLTYDLNWSEVGRRPIRTWMQNPAIDYIGISEYQDISSSPQALSEAQILRVWQQSLLPGLDSLSAALGKPLLFSEVGYRNATDALYHPWDHTTTAPPDPQLQAAAYQAATEAVFGDPHLVGMYFWAWDNGVFAPSAAAQQVLQAQYLSPAA